MVGAVGEMASMKRLKLWKTGEGGLLYVKCLRTIVITVIPLKIVRKHSVNKSSI